MKLLFYVLYVFAIIPGYILVAQEVEVLDHTAKINIRALDVLNTEYRECNLSLLPDGEALYFMSTRIENPRNRSLYGQGDLYKSNFQKSGFWGVPQKVSELNTRRGEDEPSVSFDGQKIVFQSWKDNWAETGGPYYEAHFKDGVVESIRGLGGGINQYFRMMFRAHSGYATDGMSISPDGNTFIVACGPSYAGNMDLYYSTKKQGSWSYPKLLGVSTKADERSVFIASDNTTFYFSSDGHGGFGGLDILKSSLKNGKVGSISNIGKPFNSASNDMGFVISGEGAAAFFVRNLDIWFADLSRLASDLKPKRTALVYGKIEVNQQPVQMTVVVTCDDEILGQTRSNAKGNYTLSIPGLSKVAIVSVLDDREGLFSERTIEPIENERYTEYSIDFIARFSKSKKSIADSSNIKNQEKEIELLVNFDFDSFGVNPIEASRIKQIISEFIDSNKCEFKLIGHTDFIGPEAYNMRLSKSRAVAVASVLKKDLGVDSNLISIDFKGEQNPLNPGVNQTDRAKNRRVVIRITKV
ncbi:MAG: OmpA family protein [Crocinitomicaceae bacterium]|tara:strand:+ start:27713 stop:29290 length:1578 start_codon:yes stop_codon:yes gene_type:complete